MNFKPKTEKILIDCLLLTLAIFIPYHQVAQHTFTDYDDNTYLFQNNHINLGLTWDSISWAFTDTEHPNWHPLTWISHLIDRELFSAHPGGYLLMNVGWHTLAACLAYLAFLKCTRSRVFALTVALIFALHPVNVENVAWASERKSLLNAVFWFAAIITYLDFIGTKSLRAYGLTVIFFILSLFSKAMSVTLPCSLALIHCLYLIYSPDHRSLPETLRRDWKQITRPVLPLLVLSLYFSAVTASAQSIAMPVDYPLASRLINALISYQRYLVMFFHPTELAFFYPLNYDDPLEFQSAVPALLILVTLSSTALLLLRRAPQILIGWCWFLGTMVPVIGLVQVGAQSHADRYLYIPMLGLAFIFPVLFEQLRSLTTWAKNTVIGVSLTVLGVAMILATQLQVTYWKDGVTLCRHSLTIAPHGSNAVMSLIYTYKRTGRFEELRALVDAEIPFERNHFQQGILVTLKALDLYGQERYSEARKTAQWALNLGHTNKTSFALLALTSYELGQPDKALRYLDKTRNAPDPSSQSSLLVYPFKSRIDELELKLARPPASRTKN